MGAHVYMVGIGVTAFIILIGITWTSPVKEKYRKVSYIANKYGKWYFTSHNQYPLVIKTLNYR